MRSKGKNVREVSKSVPDFFIRFLKNPQLLLERELSFLKFKKIHDIFVEEYKKVPNIVKLKDKSAHFDDVLIVGDIHGHYGSLLRIIKPFLEEKVDSLVFLGDYVDRGKNSFETLILLLMLATTWPNRILLLRGNHEDLHLNKHFGYYD